MSKIFELIRPKSLTDSNYEAFEYLLRWIGNDGSDYLYMFYDAEISYKIEADTINAENSATIESIIDSERKSISLTVDDLTLNDLLIVKQMLKNKVVYRLKKDGTTERFAPVSNSLNYRLMGGRYKIDFQLNMPNDMVWK